MSRVPRIHIDEAGNIRKGAPLGLPVVINGMLNSVNSAATPYVNMVGNESQIQPPPSGIATIARSAGAFDNPVYDIDAVDQGSHFGHVMNDDNNELDERELAGITQIPSMPVLFFANSMGGNDDSLFMNGLSKPPGVGAPGSSRRGGGGLPRLPGGGVGVPYSDYLRSDSNAMDRLRYGPNGGISLADEGISGGAHDAIHTVQQGSSLKFARELTAAGVANPLEAANPQAQKVLRREKKRDKKMGKKGSGGKKIK